MRTTLIALLLPLAARAHDGHGIDGASHWHAGDTFGFVVAGALLVAALLWRK